MKLSEIKNLHFKQLLESFLILLEKKSYKNHVRDNYRRTLAKIDLFMQENSINRYSPEVGICYYEQYFREHHIGKCRKAAMQTAIRRLNDFYLGKEFEILHSCHNTIILPNNYEAAIKAYEQSCHEAGNKDNTVLSKCQKVRNFLHFCIGLGCPDVANLSPEYVTKACLMLKNKDSWAVVRSFLRFIFLEGWTDTDHSTVVPHFKRGFKLPANYSIDEIKRVEAAVDRGTSLGKRDYAMILLATRLGMRSGDIVSLCKSDIDFYNNRITFIQQKGGGQMCLPLLSEVSEALADYLFNARPDSTENRIFLRCVAPFQPVTTSVLRFETSKYFEAAGIDTKGRKHGPHTFRSSLATSMVNDHIPYEAVRKILGHTDPDAVKHYARLDIERLRLCAVEVPEATGLFAEFLKGGPAL